MLPGLRDFIVIPRRACIPVVLLQAAVEDSYTKFKTAQAGQRSAGFGGVTIPVAWHVISQVSFTDETTFMHLQNPAVGSRSTSR